MTSHAIATPPRSTAITEPRSGQEYARNPVRRGPVLLAVDGNELSDGPAIAARLLAERLSVPLELVTVLESASLYGNVNMVPSATAALVEATRRDDRIEEVEEYAARFLNLTPAPRIHVRYGSVARTIAGAAREVRASAVVVGASPHYRRGRIIGGERAAQILRRADCPVVSVAPGFAELPRQAVVGVDFSPSSVRAAQAALLLLADGGTLELVHALEPVEYMARLRDATGRDFDTAVQSLFTRLRAELEPFVPPAVVVSTRVVGRDAVSALLELADVPGASMIAVGTHGPTLIERVFAGSVAASVLHASEQTVVAAPPPAAADALSLKLHLWGTAVASKPDDWSAALNTFTQRNAGRRVTMEVDDPGIGAQVAESGHCLLGVAYDPTDQRIEIMLGDTVNPRRHLTHTILAPDAIAMSAANDGSDEALQITHGDGYTLLMFAREHEEHEEQERAREPVRGDGMSA